MNIVKMRKVSKPSVSYAIKHLRECGYLTMDADKLIRLTESGQKIAEQVLEKHAVLRDCLIAMGVEPLTAEKDACQMEHVVSPNTIKRMKVFIDERTSVSK